MTSEVVKIPDFRKNLMPVYWKYMNQGTLHSGVERYLKVLLKQPKLARPPHKKPPTTPKI